MIHFIRPSFLILLLPTVLYLLWTIYAYRAQNPWRKVCDAHLLDSLLQKNTVGSQKIFYTFIFLFFLISIFALAGPSWKKTTLPIYREMNSLMLVLELSSAMNNIDIKPDRLTRAKYKIRDLINGSRELEMGLVVFSSEAFTVSPLSQDANTLKVLLDELNPNIMPILGSDSGEGLTAGYQLLKQTSAAQGHLLLMTASDPTPNSRKVAKTIAKGGGHLDVLAMLANTSENHSIIDNLQTLAKIGNGRFYFFTQNSHDVSAILNNIKDKKVVQTNTQTAYLWQDEGPWFCLLLIPFALFCFRAVKK